jgi:hypothetical protein
LCAWFETRDHCDEVEEREREAHAVRCVVRLSGLSVLLLRMGARGLDSQMLSPAECSSARGA